MCGDVRKKFVCFIAALLTYGVQLAIAVKINNLQVPEIIKHRSPVVLDCDFTLESSDQDLVVKWFKNDTLVYQWIPGSNVVPTGLGILKGRLNLDYKASVDANSIHRALHILNVDPDLSGEYTCSVSTMQSEDKRTKKMLVFVPESSLVLRRLKAEKGIMKVQCSAEAVYPRPEMTLTSQQREVLDTEVIVSEDDNRFNVSAFVTLLELEDPEEFTCELKIPQANYTVRRETVFYPDVLSEYDVLRSQSTSFWSPQERRQRRWTLLISTTSTFLFLLLWTHSININIGLC